MTDNQQDTELTFDQCQEVEKFLEGYKNNPSNSNKYRIGLHAYINDLIAQHTERAEAKTRLNDMNAVIRLKNVYANTELSKRGNGWDWLNKAEDAIAALQGKDSDERSK